jgi:hypothetical protein
LAEKKFRVPVLIDRDLYDVFKTYSEITGIPVVRVIREALTDYRETSLETRIEMIKMKTIDGGVIGEIDQRLTPDFRDYEILNPEFDS